MQTIIFITIRTRCCCIAQFGSIQSLSRVWLSVTPWTVAPFLRAPAVKDLAEAWPRGATPRPRSGAAAEIARPWWLRRGREELHHIRGQGRWLGGATQHPRSSACAGEGGPRGATPHSRSGGAAMRRYPSSKVRSSGCALLEQPWRDTPCPR